MGRSEASRKANQSHLHGSRTEAGKTRGREKLSQNDILSYVY